MTTPRRPAPPAASMSGQLRTIILARGLSAHALARRADVAPSILSRFLNGRRGLTLDTFDRVAAALGLGLVELGRRPAPGRPGPPSRTPRPSTRRVAAAPGHRPAVPPGAVPVPPAVGVAGPATAPGEPAACG